MAEKHLKIFDYNKNKTIDINEFNVDQAVLYSRIHMQETGSRPYAFRFTESVDGKCIKQHEMHYLGGEIVEISELRKDQTNEILINRMESMNSDRIITNEKCAPFRNIFTDDCVLLDVDF